MKINKIAKIVISVLGVSLLICITMIFFFPFSVNAIWDYQEKTYYSDRDNFIADVAIIKNIIYNKETNTLYFWLSEISDSYQDSTFKIKGKSVSIVLENNSFKELQIGDEIEFISAPGYFGDGYCMPIVAISVEREEILSFEEGYENLMELY